MSSCLGSSSLSSSAMSLPVMLTIPSLSCYTVIPIYKGKGNKNEAGNYRPISLLSHIMKIFEKQIKTQLMFYFEDNALISADQSAYRKQHNTQTALHKVIDDWFYNMSDGNLTAVCSLDIKKCFDTINHFILFKKMLNGLNLILMTDNKLFCVKMNYQTNARSKLGFRKDPY